MGVLPTGKWSYYCSLVAVEVPVLLFLLYQIYELFNPSIFYFCAVSALWALLMRPRPSASAELVSSLLIPLVIKAFDKECGILEPLILSTLHFYHFNDLKNGKFSRATYIAMLLPFLSDIKICNYFMAIASFVLYQFFKKIDDKISLVDTVTAVQCMTLSYHAASSLKFPSHGSLYIILLAYQLVHVHCLFVYTRYATGFFGSLGRLLFFILFSPLNIVHYAIILLKLLTANMQPYGQSALEIATKLIFDKGALWLYMAWLFVTLVFGYGFYRKVCMENEPLDGRLQERNCKDASVAIYRKWLHIYLAIQVALGLAFKRILLVNTVLAGLLFLGIELEVLRQTAKTRDADHPVNQFLGILFETFKFFGEGAKGDCVTTSHLSLFFGIWCPILACLVFDSGVDLSLAAVGIIVLGVSDSLAAIVGVRFSKLDYNSKSWQGSLAHFLSLAGALSLVVYMVHGLEVLMGRAWGILASSLLGCLCEAGVLESDNTSQALLVLLVYRRLI